MRRVAYAFFSEEDSPEQEERKRPDGCADVFIFSHMPAQAGPNDTSPATAFITRLAVHLVATVAFLASKDQ